MPAVFLFIGISFGIILATISNSWLAVFLALALTIAAWLLISDRLALVIFLLLVVVGWLRVTPVLNQQQQLKELAAFKRPTTVKGRVIATISPITYLFQPIFIKQGQKAKRLRVSFLVINRQSHAARGEEQILSGRFVKKQRNVYFLVKENVEQKKKPSFFVKKFNKIKQVVSQLYPPSTAALFLALVFGIDDSISMEIKQAYVETGLLHLFAASGFNVALASLSLFYFLKWLQAPKYLALLLALLSLGGYYLLIGPSPSVIRACLMTTLMLLAVLVGRPRQIFNLLFLSAFLILLHTPLSLFNISFQLSYGAVAGLAYFQKWLEELFASSNSFVRSLTTTVAAQLGVLPVQLYYFQQLSLIAPVANLLALPLVAVITVIGFYGAVGLFIWPSVSIFILKQIKFLFTALAFVVDGLAALPANTVTFSHPKVAFLGSMFFLITLIMLKSKQQQLKGKLNLFFLSSFLLLLVTLNFFLPLTAKIKRWEIEAYFFNVGQGDATLIKVIPTNMNILVDGGPSYPLLRRYLQQRRVLKLDLIVISHEHADHISALSGLVNRYKVGAVLVPSYQPKSYLYQQLLAKIKRRRIKLLYGVRGQKLKLGLARVFIFWPTTNPLLATPSDANNNSLVFKLSYKKLDFLFMGDAQLEAISRFVKNSQLEAEILKVSHQGSYNGTTASLLKRLKARLAIIFVAAGNQYGHPHKATLNLLKRFNVKTLRTDRNGTVSIFSNGFKTIARPELATSF